MCGIAGLWSQAPFQGKPQLESMLRTLVHRGPDDSGIVGLTPGIPSGAQNDSNEEQHQLFLGHRRLSIIDLSGTQQPLPNEDKTIWVSFNGEIYNYLDLRDLLSSKGHVLREQGDTEVLVHLWEEYGVDMLEHLVGMFALAIYDTNDDTLFLARDRFGQKPLFYWNTPELFSFASELQALKQLQNFPLNESDPIAVAQYFRYGYIPSPRTFYAGVFSLEPGCYLIHKGGSSRIGSYWRPRVTGEKQTIDLEELQALLDSAVRLRLRSDVPLGAFLSGGIDSALICSSAMKQLERPLATYTIATDSAWFNEAQEAQETATALGTDHHTFQVQPDFVSVSEMLAKHYGQPFADPSAVLTYYVSRETRKHATVALAGDGGDELFGGYGSYTNAGKYALWGRVPMFARPTLAALAQHLPNTPGRDIRDAILSARKTPEKGENISGLFHEYWQNDCFTEEFKSLLKEHDDHEIDRFVHYFNEAESSDDVDRWMEADQRMYLPDDILTKVDIASMAVSLECRAPFLDHRLAEYANGISSKAKLKSGQTKFLLKELAKQQLPATIASRPKKGFSMPLADWLRDEIKEWAETTVLESNTAWQDYLSANTLRSLWDTHKLGKQDQSLRLWAVISLTLATNSA